ncbi:IS66 C-terminal element [Rhizobiales bacterium GAS188]|nr:IS66 C-terminal element [Rhizobiales bacterium GAS188]
MLASAGNISCRTQQCLATARVQTAKLNGLNPEACMRDTPAKIADGHPISRIDELMPWYQRSHHAGAAS